MDTEAILALQADFERQMAEKDAQIEALIEALGRQAQEIRSLKGLLSQARFEGLES